MRSPCCRVFAQNGAFSHIPITFAFLSLPDALTRHAAAKKDVIMKYIHSIRNSTVFGPAGTWRY
jgi:hypothetical protein